MTVHVLTIEHRHGANVSVFATRAGAEADLFAFVAEWWEENPDRRGHGIPADPAEAIDAYFDDADEWYRIDECEVHSMTTIPSTPHVAEIAFERSDALYQPGGAVPWDQPTRHVVTVDLPHGPWLSIVYSGLRDQDGRFIAFHDLDTDNWYLDPDFGDGTYPWSDITIAIIPPETQP